MHKIQNYKNTTCSIREEQHFNLITNNLTNHKNNGKKAKNIVSVYLLASNQFNVWKSDYGLIRNLLESSEKKSKTVMFNDKIRKKKYNYDLADECKLIHKTQENGTKLITRAQEQPRKLAEISEATGNRLMQSQRALPTVEAVEDDE